MRLALFEPDIPQNTGAILRLAACLSVAVDIIEPVGFVLSDRRLRRAGMDYLDAVELTRHRSWQVFAAGLGRSGHGGRLVLLTTRAAVAYTDFAFRPDDVLLVGRESAGVPPASAKPACGPEPSADGPASPCGPKPPAFAEPASPCGPKPPGDGSAGGGREEVHDAAAARVRVPMVSGLRSLNVALAAAMVLGEALRQTGGFPGVER